MQRGMEKGAILYLLTMTDFSFSQIKWFYGSDLSTKTVVATSLSNYTVNKKNEKGKPVERQGRKAMGLTSHR
jgi:hypothetical protein